MNNRLRGFSVGGRLAGPLALGTVNTLGGVNSLGNGLGGGRNRNRLGTVGSIGGIGQLSTLGVGGIGTLGNLGGGLGALNGLTLGSIGGLNGLGNLGAVGGFGTLGGPGALGGLGALGGGLGVLGGCSMCQLHPVTGEHMCQCYNAEQLIALGQMFADSCDCQCCPIELNALRNLGVGGLGSSYPYGLNNYTLQSLRGRGWPPFM